VPPTRKLLRVRRDDANPARKPGGRQHERDSEGTEPHSQRKSKECTGERTSGRGICPLTGNGASQSCDPVGLQRLPWGALDPRSLPCSCARVVPCPPSSRPPN